MWSCSVGTHWERVSACLDRVSSVGSGPHCSFPGLASQASFWGLKCLESRTGGPFKFSHPPTHTFLYLWPTQDLFLLLYHTKSNLIVSYFCGCTVPGNLDEMWWEKLLVSDSNSQFSSPSQTTLNLCFLPLIHNPWITYLRFCYQFKRITCQFQPSAQPQRSLYNTVCFRLFMYKT